MSEFVSEPAPLLHASVLVEEVLGSLNLAPGRVIVDGTFGLGGHARKILERIGPEGRLIGLDKDADILAMAQQGLKDFGEMLILRHGDFRDLGDHLDALGIQQVDGILLDLGVSSVQLDTAARGFSFQSEGPLDMRMDRSQSLDAEAVVNESSQEELEAILENYGGERFARRIARRIVQRRQSGRIRTTSALEEIIYHAVPASCRHGRLHPATRSFQAIRIAVNGELDCLNQFLLGSTQRLKNGGRLAIISFHSLEDRQVKTEFRRFEKEGIGRMVTKKPVTPTLEEMEKNPRSRSAKLRVFERQSREAS